MTLRLPSPLSSRSPVVAVAAGIEPRADRSRSAATRRRQGRRRPRLASSGGKNWCPKDWDPMKELQDEHEDLSKANDDRGRPAPANEMLHEATETRQEQRADQRRG